MEMMNEIKNHFPGALMIILLMFIFLLATSPVRPAEVYKWKDKDGKIIFSDSPPPAGVDAEIRKFKEEPAPIQRTTPNLTLPQPKSEMVKVKWTPAQMDLDKQLTSNLTPSELFALVNPSVWTVISASSDISPSSAANPKTMKNTSLGSAVAIGENRLLTNYHVIDERPHVVVKHGDRFEKAIIISGDRQTDRCILHVPNAILKPVKGFKRYHLLVIGETVYSIGSPKGLENTLGQGIISGKRELPELRLIQTTAQISKGSSGGGLFDNFGNLIGMTTFKVLDSDSLNFAIAIEDFTQ
jgi:S1-C subfamily serine protease